MESVMIMKERCVFYLCNGKNEKCRKKMCNYSGDLDGFCKHTNNREYALHPDISPETDPERFIVHVGDLKDTYWEEEAT